MHTIDVGGQQIEAEAVDFEVVSDSWQILRLSDGTRLRVKPVVIDVVRTKSEPEKAGAYGIRYHLVAITDGPAPAPQGETKDRAE